MLVVDDLPAVCGWGSSYEPGYKWPCSPSIIVAGTGLVEGGIS